MVKLCEVLVNKSNYQQKSNAYALYTDFYQTQLLELFLMELIPFVLIPCACLIGLFLNWKIIQTLKINEKKDLKEDFYKYMSANAKFNCLYCLIFVFYPMTSCTWRLSYHFCSSIFTSQFVQYYKFIMIAYFGEVVKMCANVSYIMMTLNRYLLVGKDHQPWLVTIAKLELKWVIRGSILLSAIINIGHGWEYQAVEDFAIINYDSTYSDINGASYSDYPQANQGTPFLIYSIVYFCINFGIFFILNTGLEVKIVRRMQKELKEKRERLSKMYTSHKAVEISSAEDNECKIDLEREIDEERGGGREKGAKGHQNGCVERFF
jgi:hypothetical protein